MIEEPKAEETVEEAVPEWGADREERIWRRSWFIETWDWLFYGRTRHDG
jgi:hypothetical protein